MDEADRVDCPEHLWRLLDAVLGDDGAISTYVCERCGGELAIFPGEVAPGTA